MQDRPTAAELLDAVATFLQDDLLPELTGQKAFHVRVSANLLRILEREWELEPRHLAEDRAGMGAVLGHDGDPQDLRAELAEAIRAGALDRRHDEVLRVLREAARRKLEVANPRYVR